MKVIMITLSLTKLKEYLSDSEILEILGIELVNQVEAAKKAPKETEEKKKPLEVVKDRNKKNTKPEKTSKYTYDEVIQKSIEINEEFDEDDADSIMKEIKDKLQLKDFADIQEQDFDTAISFFEQELAE